MATKEKAKPGLRKEFLFIVLSVEKEKPNQDWKHFSRPRNMVIVCTSLLVLTNHDLSYHNKRTLLWTIELFLILHE